MKNYENLTKVLENLDDLNWYGILYTNRESWSKDPKEAKFIYLEGDDELDDLSDDETMLPRLAEENDVERFLETQVFQDVVDKQKELNPNSKLDDFINALNYYLEYDTFYWPKK